VDVVGALATGAGGVYTYSLEALLFRLVADADAAEERLKLPPLPLLLPLAVAL
jgi:hypothetical protein